MQDIATSQRLTLGTLAIPTFSHGTPNRHYSGTSQVGIGGRGCSKSREIVIAGPHNHTNKRDPKRGRSKELESHEIKDHSRVRHGCSSEPKKPQQPNHAPSVVLS